MGRRRHQNISGFQVLVQYAGGVRGCYRSGDVGEQVQPNPQRNPGQTSLTLGPLREVWTPILAFEEERVSVEIPFQDADKFRTLAERFLQEPGDGHLALQTFETHCAGCKLEDAELAGLRVSGQPDFAAGGNIQRTHQSPVIASGNRITLFEAQFRRGWRSANYFALYRSLQPISHAWHSDHYRGLLVPQGLAQLVDGGGERAFHNRQTGPDSVQQFVLGDHFSGMQQELNQNLKGF